MGKTGSTEGRPIDSGARFIAEKVCGTQLTEGYIPWRKMPVAFKPTFLEGDVADLTVSSNKRLFDYGNLQAEV